jgi:hypothetical protein
MTDHIKALAADLKAKLAVALAAELKLLDAQDRAGLSAPKQIWTGADIKAMRTEWYEEWLAMTRASTRRSRSPFARQTAATNATADDIIRAGKIRRGENIVDLKRK